MPYESLKFIHVANLQLDSPRDITEEVPASLQNIVEDATLIAFQNIVDCCQEHNVDFLILAGNSFCEAEQSLRARLALVEGLQQLSEFGIRTFVLPGKLDPLPAWRNIQGLSESVTIFHGTCDDPVAILRDDRLIATISVGSMSDFQKTDIENSEAFASHWKIGIAELSAETSEPHSSFTFNGLHPLTVDYLIASGNGNSGSHASPSPMKHHPETSQALREQDSLDVACTFVEMEPGQVPKSTPIPVIPVQRQFFSLDLSSIHTMEKLQEEIISQIRKLSPGTNEQVRFITGQLHGNGEFLNSLENDETLQGLKDFLEQSVFPNSTVRLVAEFQIANSTDNAATDNHCLELARQFQEILNQKQTDLSRLLAEGMEQLDGNNSWKQLPDSFETTLSQPRILQHARDLGQTWFGTDLSESESS
ncbi:MAG: hypothetical protein Tsb009_12900 [Planctomycetaceae bacterium]